MTNFIVVNIRDNLASGYKRMSEGMINFAEASEVLNQKRRFERDLIYDWVYTANLVLVKFGSDGSKEVGITGRTVFKNIAGENIDNFCNQILNRKGNFYKLTPKEISSLPYMGLDINWAKSSDLNLYDDEGTSIFSIYTYDRKAKNLNPAEKLIVQKVFGSLNKKYDPEQKLSDYEENMKMLNDAGIGETFIFFPSLTDIVNHFETEEVVAVPTMISPLTKKHESYFFATDEVSDIGTLCGYNSL